MPSSLRTALCLCLLTGLASAQAAGDFTTGDLFLYTPAATGISSADGGIIRIDPLSGTTTLMVQFDHTLSSHGAICYDSYRQRLVFCADPDVPSAYKLLMMDGTGVLTSIGYEGISFEALAPTGDGRIYMHPGSDAVQPFRYLDAANQMNILWDASGTAAFTVPGMVGYQATGVIYDAGENALFIANRSSTNGKCPGGSSTEINVFKAPLSPDGSQVTGTVSCSQFDVDLASGGESPVNWSRGPAGMLMLVVDTNSNAQQSRMLLVDPVSLAITSYAANSNSFAAATNAGSYSNVLGEAVILDSGNDVLRAFALGETGNGTILTTPGEVSSPGSSGETATLVEVAPGACAGAFVPYGTGLAGTGGDVPEFSMSGCAVPAGAIAAHVDDVVGGASGLMLFGTAAASLPFKAGTLLVAPIFLTLPITVGGAPGVAGAGSVDLPTALPNDPLLSGFKLYTQIGFQDAGAIENVSLTNAVLMEIG